MIGNVFENYCWNGDIGNWFDFLSSKRAFFKYLEFKSLQICVGIVKILDNSFFVKNKKLIHFSISL